MINTIVISHSANILLHLHCHLGTNKGTRPTTLFTYRDVTNTFSNSLEYYAFIIKHAEVADWLKNAD